jgi:dephospho-CoA kinase
VFKVGLTGGIGCGKTTVADLFSQFKVPIIDADIIAHQVVAIGQPALRQIQQTFGTNSLHNDGSLNRTYIRDLIFNHPEQKQQLEAIVHPLVHQSIIAQLATLNSPYCIISIPLLFETHNTDFVDSILVIDCPVAMQIERVMARDNLTLERVQSIIASQVSHEFRISHADNIINNGSNNTALAQQVEKLHNLYLSLSTH